MHTTLTVPKSFEGGDRQVLHARLLGDIRRNGDCLGAACAQCLLNSLERLLFDVGQNQPYSLCRERTSQRKTNSAGRAGYYGDPFCQILHEQSI
jgi:hypothetical protein